MDSQIGQMKRRNTDFFFIIFHVLISYFSLHIYTSYTIQKITAQTQFLIPTRH